MVLLFDRVLGCMLGGAYGDALGWPVEFLSKRQIVERYGLDGIVKLDPASAGQITDDTQMTLFTVEGIIRGWVRQSIKGVGHTPSVVHHAYFRWLDTQDPGFYVRTRDQQPDGWLIGERRLHVRRAPGNTCVAALSAARRVGDAATNDSKGCGAVMRSAPFGFVSPDPSRCFEIAVECARYTHGNPSGYFAAGAFAIIINAVVQGREPLEATSQALTFLREIENSDEVRAALAEALQIAKRDDWRDLLPKLGQGWVAEEALAISILCVIAAKTPIEALIASVNHSGDSDSTGSITGNILGAMYGRAAFPSDDLVRLELTDVIQQLATDFSVVLEGGANSREMWDRYPGH